MQQKGDEWGCSEYAESWHASQVYSLYPAPDCLSEQKWFCYAVSTFNQRVCTCATTHLSLHMRKQEYIVR